MTELAPGLIKIMTHSPATFEFTTLWPDNIVAWLCYAEAEFHDHGVSDQRVQFFAVEKALLHDSEKYVTPSSSTSDVSELYTTVDKTIIKRVDLINRQSLRQFF